MSAPPEGDLPSDIDELARIAANVDESLGRRNAAFGQLVPCIRFVARRVAMRFSSQAGVDLPDNALLDVWERLPRRNPADRFEPWCYTVLRHRVIDQIRHEQVERRHSREAARKRSEKIPALLPGDDCLPAVVLEAVDGWPAHLRLAVLGRKGLWHAVPASWQEKWTEKYAEQRGVPLAASDISDALRNAAGPRQVNGALAAVLRVKPNTLAVWLKRGEPWLRRLR